MAVTLLGAVLAVLIAFVGWVSFQVLAQNGRILERVSRLEDALDNLQPAPAQTCAGVHAESLKTSRLIRDGLPQGTVAPDFQLPLVSGGDLSLSQHRGRRVLLVFSDPRCGPCDALAPQLQQRHVRRTDVDVIMISRGDAAANARKVAEHRLTFPVAVQRQWEISRQYGMFATPIGFLIDEQGIIAAPVAVGAGRILALLPERGVSRFLFKPRPPRAQA
jgi:peroxiredoxin